VGPHGGRAEFRGRCSDEGRRAPPVQGMPCSALSAGHRVFTRTSKGGTKEVFSWPNLLVVLPRVVLGTKAARVRADLARFRKNKVLAGNTEAFVQLNPRPTRWGASGGLGKSFQSHAWGHGGGGNKPPRGGGRSTGPGRLGRGAGAQGAASPSSASGGDDGAARPSGVHAMRGKPNTIGGDDHWGSGVVDTRRQRVWQGSGARGQVRRGRQASSTGAHRGPLGGEIQVAEGGGPPAWVQGGGSGRGGTRISTGRVSRGRDSRVDGQQRTSPASGVS